MNDIVARNLAVGVRLWKKGGHWVLAHVERFFYSYSDALDYSGTEPVIFIIGPPRSGSTLLMQVLTDAFALGYLSNFHCAWRGMPAVGEKLVRPLDRKERSDFGSNYGKTSVISDPAECGGWWYRFFRRDPPYVTLSDVSEGKMRAFRQSIAALQEAMQLPLIFKNLYASLRIEPIAEHIPGALFVVIERDVVDNAQSILKARMDALGTYDSWWSVPPPNVEELRRLRPVEQAVEQVRSVHALIDRDIERLGLEDRCLRIKYEEFCGDVPGTLARFEAFVGKNGVVLERRFEVPEGFEIDRSRKIPDAMYGELCEYVRSGRRDGVGVPVAAHEH